MNKLFPLAASLASLALSTSGAWAIDCSQAYSATIYNGSDPIDCGTISLVSAGEADTSYGASGCRYFARWRNNASLPKSANLRLDEHTTPDYWDCGDNSTKAFTTLIVLGPGSNYGFDGYQQKQLVNQLVCGLDGEWGDCRGLIQLNGGYLYSFEMKIKQQQQQQQQP